MSYYHKAATYRLQRQRTSFFSWNIVSFFKIISSGLGVALLFYIGCQLYSLLITLPYFNLTTVQLTGNKKLTPTEVMQKAGVVKGQCLFGIDPQQLAASLLIHPYIKSATVSRELPRSLTIKVKERKEAVLAYADSFYLVAEDGVILSSLSTVPRVSLPIISGLPEEEITIGGQKPHPYLKKGLELLSLWKRILPADDISEICLRDSSNPMIYTCNDHIQIRLGGGEPTTKFKRLHLVLTNLNARRHQLKYIDLRFKQMVIVKFR